MANFDGDAETTARALADAAAGVNERDQLRRRGENIVDVSGRLRTALNTAQRSLDKLSAKLRESETAAGVSQKELQRRRDIVRKHQAELTRLRGLEKTVVVSSDRDALLGSSGAGAAKYTEEAPRATAEQLLARTQDEMKSQDTILDSMSKGLDSLKTIGVAIRDETDLHMKLLDDLDGEVDKGNANLKRETARAEHITRDTKTCWLYVTICLLLAILVGLVAFFFA